MGSRELILLPSLDPRTAHHSERLAPLLLDVRRSFHNSDCGHSTTKHDFCNSRLLVREGGKSGADSVQPDLLGRHLGRFRATDSPFLEPMAWRLSHRILKHRHQCP